MFVIRREAGRKFARPALHRFGLHRVLTAGLLVLVLSAPALASSNVQSLFTNQPEVHGYQLGDFDGDGVTDLFRISGTQWQYAPGGVGSWRNLSTDSTALGDLRFGDFNGDGVTDVFRLIPDGGTNQWQVSWGGRTAWANLAGDPRPLSDLRFGDFDGDGRTDVFSLNAGGQWIFSPGGNSGWRNLAAEPATPLGDLRFGDFDGDGRTDVFRAVWTGATYQWQYSASGTGGWQNLAADPTPVGDLGFADFNGDGFTDVFRSAGNQWQYSPGARLPWVNLAADSSPFIDLRFGDFDGDGRSDVFNVAGGQPRYSAGGVRAWTSLVPGSRTIYDLRLGDFNNDGVTDVFRAVWNGSTYQWQYSPGGVGAWENLASDPTPIELLRFGDFNGDGYTDVFRLIASGGTNQWQYSPRSRDAWQNLASDPALLTELRFGDFNGDGRTDVFSVARQTDGGGNFTTYQWRYAPGGQNPWQNLAGDPTPLANLRFAYFDANATTDVFSRQRTGATYNDATYLWRYSPDGNGGWQPLASDPLNLTGLRFADLDGNGITDIFSVTRETNTYQWRYSPDARSPWQPLASDAAPLSELRFGDFNGDGRADVFGIAPDGRWRYSPGGSGGWILLGPPTEATPTYTPTPTPTGTYYPTPTPTLTSTGQPPPGPACQNVLVNGGFESSSAWTFGNSPIPGTYTSIQRRSGARAVQLGNPPDSGHGDQVSYSSIRQSVMVPRHAQSVQLRFWHYYQSAQGSNPNPSSSQDRQEVILLTPQGNTLQILSRVLRNDNGWQQTVIDLSSYAGQSFYVYFNVYNDGNGARTWMYLDDVELSVCGGTGYASGPAHPPTYKPPVYQPPVYQPPYQGPPANYNPPSGYQPQPYKPGMGQRPPGGWMPPGGQPGQPSATPMPTSTPENEAAYVVSVVTGDTIVVRIGGVDYTVRYLGIDAPELNEDFGDDAAGLNDFLVAGNIVYLEQGEADTDRFGRLLRYVFLDDGTFVNLELVRMGLARAVDADGDDRYLADLLQAEIEAREAGVGLWSNGGDMNGASGLENGDENGAEMSSLRPQSDLSGQSLPQLDTMMATPTPGPVDFSAQGDEDANGDKGGTTANSNGVNGVGNATGFVPADTAALLEGGEETSGALLPETLPLPDPQFAPLPVPLETVPDDGVNGEGNGEENGEAAQTETRFVEPEQCVELMNNGGFEAPDTGWNLRADGIRPVYTTEQVFNQSRYALRLGLAGDALAADGAATQSGISAVDQLVYLPESADSIVLSFRYLPVYDGEPGPGDLQYVDIYNGLTGQFAGRVLSEQRHAENWLPVNYDLTQLAGQPVRLVFAVNNDGVAGTMGMYVDFVSIWACNLPHLATPASRTNQEELALPGVLVTPTAGPEPSSSSIGSQSGVIDESRGWVDRIATVLTMGGIFGAIALVTVVAVGVRQARRASKSTSTR